MTQEDLQNFYKMIKRDMKSMKTSLQTDYRERTSNILTNLAVSGISLVSDQSLNTFRGLLPKTTLPEFQEFDESMKEDSEHLKTLVS